MSAVKSNSYTPFAKQCFVTVGVSLNMMGQGLIASFMGVLMPAIHRPDSPIPGNNWSFSWIVSIIAFALVGGNIVVPVIMSRYGRRVANLISIISLSAGWFVFASAVNIPMLLVARCLQGISIGMSACLGPILIGEYTSAKNRAAFLTTISLAIGVGRLSVDILGPYVTWREISIIGGLISLANLFIVFNSPESPSFLAEKLHFDECRTVFRWLRGDGENEELENMIKAIQEREKNKAQLFDEKMTQSTKNLNSTIWKKHLFKPIILMMMIYTTCHWTGSFLSAYIFHIYSAVMNGHLSISTIMIIMDIETIMTSTCAIFVVKKVKRRTLLFATGGLDVVTLLVTTLYFYAETNNLLPSDPSLVGNCLIHLLILTMAISKGPLFFIIAGEIFPLQHRCLSGGICQLFSTLNVVTTTRLASWLFLVLGISEACVFRSIVVALCLVVAGWLMPETKDLTLQEIEDGFRGRVPSFKESKHVESLGSIKV